MRRTRRSLRSRRRRRKKKQLVVVKLTAEGEELLKAAATTGCLIPNWLRLRKPLDLQLVQLDLWGGATVGRLHPGPDRWSKDSLCLPDDCL